MVPKERKLLLALLKLGGDSIEAKTFWRESCQAGSSQLEIQTLVWTYASSLIPLVKSGVKLENS